MSTKAELARKIEASSKDVLINPDNYKKDELDAIVLRIAKEEPFTDLLKEDGNQDGESKPGGRSIVVTHPETGQEMPRADYIRERFEGGAHRREITEELGVAYQIVFASTRDLTNAHHAPGKRGGNSSQITVTNEEGEEVQIARTEYMRQEYRNGRERSEIANELGVSYGLIYSATKDVERDPEVVEAAKREASANVAEEDGETVDAESLEQSGEEAEELFPSS